MVSGCFSATASGRLDCHLGRVSQFVAADQSHRAGGAPVDFQPERTPEMGRLARITLAQAAVQFRIARFPEPVANMNPAEIQIVPPETEDAQSRVRTPRLLHAIDPAALFFFVGPAGVKYNAVAGLERGFQMGENFLPFDALHGSEIDAAFLAKTGVDQPLVVDSAEPARVQSARKSHFQIVARFAGRAGRRRPLPAQDLSSACR